MEKYEYKPKIKVNESLDTLRTIDTVTEKKEDKKRKKKLKKIKKKKQNFIIKIIFHQKKNNLNNSFYSDNGIKYKIERQITSERELNILNDQFSSNEKKHKIKKYQVILYHFYLVLNHYNLLS